MISKMPSIIFPEKQCRESSSTDISKEYIHSLCNFRPFTLLVGSMANYVIEKSKTHELKRQYSAMSKAVDAEYTEAENQAYIQFREMSSRLEEDFKLKSRLLEKEMQLAEAEADKAYHENRVTFERYVKTSELYKKIFDVLRESAKSISEIITYAENEDIALNTKHYVKLCEQYRILIRGIEKYSEFIA